MQRLLTLALIGLVAQLIDGSLGMAYGVTSSSLLLVAGVTPVAASASVHMAEVVTTIASGASHWRFGNVNLRVTLALAGPGAIGAFLGAVFLASIPGDTAKPFVAVFLFLLGVSILIRFINIARGADVVRPQRVRRRFLLVPLALFGGFSDAAGGGGWGPITTSTLMSRRDMEPRRVVGSVDTSETAVALSATLGFMIMLGLGGFNFVWVVALMAGGLVAAPIAAWLVARIPAYLLGILVSGVILFTNLRTVAQSLDFRAQVTVVSYFVLLGIWLAALTYVVMRQRTLIKVQTSGD